MSRAFPLKKREFFKNWSSLVRFLPKAGAFLNTRATSHFLTDWDGVHAFHQNTRSFSDFLLLSILLKALRFSEGPKLCILYCSAPVKTKNKWREA
jgi:hypothetical protein